MRTRANRAAGFTLVEVLLAVAVAGLLMAALGGLVSQALQARAVVSTKNDLLQQAEFAMERMVSAVRGTTRLLLPLAENPGTAWSESARDPGVLAVTLGPTIDRDHDGFADADNDGDGRLDEDPGNDLTSDYAAGIVGVDDDGDGQVDEGNVEDDDEDGSIDEDPVDGIDNDGDGSVDEDPSKDIENDGAPGVIGVDDDGDGSIDEGGTPNKDDDDEDGAKEEDWLDSAVYFLSGTDLLERMPNLNPADGTDYAERPIAQNVSRFRVERVPGARAVLVDITLEVTDPASGEAMSLHTRVRVGGGL